GCSRADRVARAMGDHAELAYWLALRRAGLGSTNFALLLRHFGSISAAWEASPGEIAQAGVERKYARGFAQARATFDAGRELALVERHGVRAYTWLDDDFPSSLRDIPQSPPVLFARGEPGPQFPEAVAVVGTRNVTPYGRAA